MIYDTLIIGAGPAGISIAINLKNKGFNVAILEGSMPGGKVNIAPRVDNFPGYTKISGPDLAFAFFEKMNNAQISMFSCKVLDVIKEDNKFIVKTTGETYESKTLVVASGTDEKKLNLPGENELLGHGLSYCAICDGHFFKDKVATVVAEDKYAISEALYLSNLCSHVYVVTKKDKLKGDKRLIDELNTHDNVSYIYNKEVVSLNGNPLENITLNDGSVLATNGIFPLLGYIPNTQFIHFDIFDEDHFIKVNREYESDVKGLFAIGDVISRELKQIYLAVIDAEKTANSVEKYLNS